MARAQLALAVATAVALLALSSMGGAAMQQTPKRGGTLVVGSVREPACINAFLIRCGDLSDIGHLMAPAIRGAFKVGPGLTWQPDLATAEITKTPPFTVTYHIRPEARWSDGVPVTAGDFVFTHETRRAHAEELINFEKEQLRAIRSVRAVGPKTVEVVLNSRDSLWRGFFSRILPRHALRGEDFSRVWLDRIVNPKTAAPIGSGPFLVRGLERGRGITYVRNTSFWGSHTAYLDRIELRYCRAPCADLGSDQVDLLRRRAADLVVTRVGSKEQVGELRSLPDVRVLAAPGPVWEAVQIRVGTGGHRALKQKLVRRALAYGIDRVAVVQALYGDIGVRYPPSDSGIYALGSVHYRPNWNAYRYRPADSRRLLEQAGCSRGGDGIYECAGERLSLRFGTPVDDPLRVATFGLVQGQLRRAGIEARAEFAPRSVFFGEVLPSSDFDLALWGLDRQTPDSPAQMIVVYGCGERRNYGGYCQRILTRDLDQARRILDVTELARVLNRADAQLARDVPVIPLLQRPLVAAMSSSLRNVSLATRNGDPFANAENWWLDR